MIITKSVNGTVITLTLAGRLDTVTSNLLSGELDNIVSESFDKLILDFFSIDYMSSAGLRVIINLQKRMTARGAKLELTGLNESIKSIFDITGFTKLLTIK
jgi:anti-sigma B factor antagonist